MTPPGIIGPASIYIGDPESLNPHGLRYIGQTIDGVYIQSHYEQIQAARAKARAVKDFYAPGPRDVFTAPKRYGKSRATIEKHRAEVRQAAEALAATPPPGNRQQRRAAARGKKKP